MYRKVLCIKDIFLNDICWFTWVWTFLAISFWFIWVWIYFETYWSLDFSWDIFLMILSDFLKFVLFWDNFLIFFESEYIWGWLEFGLPWTYLFIWGLTRVWTFLEIFCFLVGASNCSSWSPSATEAARTKG